MTGNRNYHLSFCKVCKNKSSNFKRGIICGMTNEIAEFDNFCDNYEKNENELNNLKSKIERNFKAKDYKYDSALDKFLYRFERYKKVGNNQKVFNFDKSYLRVFLVGYILIITYYTIFETDLIETSKIGSEYIIYYTITSIILLILIYLNFVKKGKPILEFYDKYLLNQPIAITGKTKSKIFWNDIINLKLEVHYKKHFSTIKIIVGTISSGITEIDITGVEHNPIEILELIKLNSKNIA